MAVASWAAGHEAGPVAWVTVDGYDNKPEVFWSYVVAALRQAGVPVNRAASALAHGDMAGHVFLLQLASSLAGHEPAVTLVLDDFHLLTDGAMLAGLTYVMKNARPGLRLVVTSRIDPQLPLHQYRLTGDLTEIRADDLAFSVSEVASLMVQHDVTLPPSVLEYLTETEEGWAAGLRMAAMSMAGHPDPEQFVKNLSAEDSAVAGYLVQEVLNVQPADVRELLLYSSVLEQVNADIASALLDRAEVAGALEALARENSFVQPVGDGWYRFHSLFRDVLRLKLRHERPDIVASLHRKAARWYQQRGMLAEAVRSAANTGDWTLAAAIMVDELAIVQLMGPDHGDLPAEGSMSFPKEMSRRSSCWPSARSRYPSRVIRRPRRRSGPRKTFSAWLARGPRCPLPVRSLHAPVQHGNPQREPRCPGRCDGHRGAAAGQYPAGVAGTAPARGRAGPDGPGCRRAMVRQSPRGRGPFLPGSRVARGRAPGPRPWPP